MCSRIVNCRLFVFIKPIRNSSKTYLKLVIKISLNEQFIIRNPKVISTRTEHFLIQNQNAPSHVSLFVIKIASQAYKSRNVRQNRVRRTLISKILGRGQCSRAGNRPSRRRHFNTPRALMNFVSLRQYKYLHFSLPLSCVRTNKAASVKSNGKGYLSWFYCSGCVTLFAKSNRRVERTKQGMETLMCGAGKSNTRCQMQIILTGTYLGVSSFPRRNFDVYELMQGYVCMFESPYSIILVFYALDQFSFNCFKKGGDFLRVSYFLVSVQKSIGDTCHVVKTEECRD